MLTILTSHPIQYQAPLWRAIAASGVSLEVLFLTPHGLEKSVDVEFGKTFSWDVDLLGGYKSRFLSIASPWNIESFRGVRLTESLAESLKANGTRYLWVEGWRFKPFWDAVRIANKLGIKVIMRGESNDLRSIHPLKAMLKKFVLSRHFRSVDRFLFIGTANRRFYSKLGVLDQQLLPAPYAVDNDYFNQQSSQLRNDRSGLRSLLGIPENSYCLLFCGKFIDKKRPLDLVEAACRLQRSKDSSKKLHLLFVGSGALGPILREKCQVLLDRDTTNTTKANESNEAVSASFVGFLNQSAIAQAFVAADLLVLPSDARETWGLVVNEAMACGTPAVVSNLCGCAEDLTRSLSSELVFKAQEIEDLVRAIRFAIENPYSTERVQAAVDSNHIRHTVQSIHSIVN